MKTLLLTLFTILVISLLSFFGYNSYKSAKTYINSSQQLSKQQGIDEIFHTKLDKILEKISLGTYDKYSKEKISKDELEAISKKNYEMSLTYLYYFLATMMLFLLIFYLLDREFLSYIWH